MSIISYSINVWNYMSEYFTVRECSEICMITSKNGLTFKQICHICLQFPCKFFNWHQLYTWKISAYDIEYMSVVCLPVHIYSSLLVCWLTLPNTLIGCLGHLQFWKPSEPLLLPCIVLSLDLQAVIFRTHYSRKCHLHGYQ